MGTMQRKRYSNKIGDTEPRLSPVSEILLNSSKKRQFLKEIGRKTRGKRRNSKKLRVRSPSEKDLDTNVLTAKHCNSNQRRRAISVITSCNNVTVYTDNIVDKNTKQDKENKKDSNLEPMKSNKMKEKKKMKMKGMIKKRKALQPLKNNTFQSIQR